MTYKQFRGLIDKMDAEIAERGIDPSDYRVVFREYGGRTLYSSIHNEFLENIYAVTGFRITKQDNRVRLNKVIEIVNIPKDIREQMEEK